MQRVRTYRVGRLFFRSLGAEGRAPARPLERLEIEIGPRGSPARSEQLNAIVIGVVLAVAAMVVLTAWQPLAGPLIAGAALVVVVIMMLRRSAKRVGWRLTVDAEQIRVEETHPLRDETRVALDTTAVEQVDIDDKEGHRSLWARTRDGERVMLVDDLTDEEAEVSVQRLRDTIPPAPA